MAIGLLVGVDCEPGPAEFEALLANGTLQAQGFQYVTLDLTSAEADNRKYVKSLYEGACAKQNWPEGIAWSEQLKVKKAKVKGKRFLVVQPPTEDDPLKVPAAAGRGEANPSAKKWWKSKRKGKANPDSERVDAVVEKMRTAGPKTLADCNKILAVAILHENMDHTGTSAIDRATWLVQYYKKPGWVPDTLSVGANTPTTSERVSGISRFDQSRSNRLLAEHLVRLAPEVDIDRAEAIGFRGGTAATGELVVGVLAR